MISKPAQLDPIRAYSRIESFTFDIHDLINGSVELKGTLRIFGLAEVFVRSSKRGIIVKPNCDKEVNYREIRERMGKRKAPDSAGVTRRRVPYRKVGLTGSDAELDRKTGKIDRSADAPRTSHSPNPFLNQPFAQYFPGNGNGKRERKWH